MYSGPDATGVPSPPSTLPSGGPLSLGGVGSGGGGALSDRLQVTAIGRLVSPSIGAERAARKGSLAAERALRAAAGAERVAGETQANAEAAVQAQGHRLGSPLKASQRGLLASARGVRPEEGFEAGATGLPPVVYVKQHTSALARLANGVASVEFPSYAMDLEHLPLLKEGLEGNTTLTSLTLARAIPVNAYAEQVLEALGGNQTLTTLDLSGNQIGTISAPEQNLGALEKLRELVDNCESLKVLNLDDNEFGSPGVELVCLGVRENVSIRTLKLSGNAIASAGESDGSSEEAGLEAMKEMLIKNKFLRSLSLRSNDLKVEHLEQLSDALKTVTRLTHLDLGNNQLESPGAALMASVLRDNQGLRYVDLSDNSIGWRGIQQVADAMATGNATLQTLILQKNKFGSSKEKKGPVMPNPDEDDDPIEDLDEEELEERRKEENFKLQKELKCSEKAVSRLADMIQENKTLTSLDLAFNHIGSDHICLVATALRSNETLTHLNLEMNHIAGCAPGEAEYIEHGIAALSESIGTGRGLQSLNLKWNFLQAPGTRLLATALRNNRTLTELNLARNFMGDEGVEALMGEVANNFALQTLDLGANRIQRAGRAIAECLRVNNTLTNLILSENPIGTTGFEAIAPLLGTSTIKLVDFTRCEITPTCQSALHLLLKENVRLRSLEMADNPVDTDTVNCAIDALETNGTITKFTLWARHTDPGDALEHGERCVRLLKASRNLIELDLGFRSVPPDVTAEIEECLLANANAASSQ